MFQVLWGENAPGLYSGVGEGVQKKLRQLAQIYGYSFSVIKTDTELHGIPQKRRRTFYFFWCTPTAPYLSWTRREKPDLWSYLADIPK